jgi:hypothetical protein
MSLLVIFSNSMEQTRQMDTFWHRSFCLQEQGFSLLLTSCDYQGSHAKVIKEGKLVFFSLDIRCSQHSDQQLLEMMTNVQDRGGNWCWPGSGSPGGLSGRSLSRWRGLAAQARTVWKGWARRTSGSPGPAPNRGCPSAVVSGATGGIAHSHFSSGGVIGRRPSRPRRGDRALLGSG